jgi:hypothetical protein
VGRLTGWWRRLRRALDGPAFARFLETFAYADGELVPGDAPFDRH